MTTQSTLLSAGRPAEADVDGQAIVQDLEHSLITQQILASSGKNYNRWLWDTISPYVGSCILEVGGSIGNLVNLMLSARPEPQLVVAIDIQPYFVSRMRERFGDRSNFAAYHFDAADPQMVDGVGRERFDTVTILNVLEHVERDDLALINARAALQPGGYLLLILPAFQFLYGSMDRADGHYRRYSLERIRGQLEAAGFVLRGHHYLNIAGTLGWFVNGRVLKRQVIPEQQLRGYDRVIPWLRRLESWRPPPFGQSLFIAAQKPA